MMCSLGTQCFLEHSGCTVNHVHKVDCEQCSEHSKSEHFAFHCFCHVLLIREPVRSAVTKHPLLLCWLLLAMGAPTALMFFSSMVLISMQGTTGTQLALLAVVKKEDVNG